MPHISSNGYGLFSKKSLTFPSIQAGSFSKPVNLYGRKSVPTKMHSKKSPPKDPSPIRLLALSLRKTGARRATWKASSQASWFPLEASTIVERNKKDANMLFVTHRGIGIFTYVTWMVDLYGRSQVVQTLYKVCSTLPKTNSSKNWKLEWLEDDSSFWGPAYFGEESRRSWECYGPLLVGFIVTPEKPPKKAEMMAIHPWFWWRLQEMHSKPCFVGWSRRIPKMS